MSFVEPLVDVEWLERNIDESDLVVLDGTLFLPGEGKSGLEEYLKGHIPGARFFDIDLFSDPDTDLPHMVPSAGRFSRLAGDLGISNEHRVVVYDTKGLFSAARVWWMFRLFGHDRVSVLDGGYSKWYDGGYPIERNGPGQWRAEKFNASLRTSWLCGLGDLDANVSCSDAIVLDARSAARFDGAAPEPRPGVRSGSIPGSRNLPYSLLLKGDHTMLSPAALRALFSEVGVDGRKPVITSCGSGVTAAVLSLGLAVAGISRVSLYDGAWAEWGACR